MKTYYLNQLTSIERESLSQRKAINFNDCFDTVKSIFKEVKQSGDITLKKLTKKYDKAEIHNLTVSETEILEAEKSVSKTLKLALQTAGNNIAKFHKAQLPETISVSIDEGITCYREFRAIEKVGLYVPGGSAPLVSTVLMLAIPARIAGCEDIIICTPPDNNGKISPNILYAANLCGVNQVFKVGGAQAIAAMNYGTNTILRVNKIFGPGNAYVTAAKLYCSLELGSAAIDLPAGPSEVMVIADEASRADFVASDLLAQAEHSPDAQAILLCESEAKANAVQFEIQKQIEALPRKDIIQSALNNSFILIVENTEQAIVFANDYAPEHLILNVENAEAYVSMIKNAGSVFLGPYSCESAGDYASGTNHTLPTYGYAKMYSGVSLESFMKSLTFQKLSLEGVKKLAPCVATLAEAEGLEAHKRAIEIRTE